MPNGLCPVEVEVFRTGHSGRNGRETGRFNRLCDKFLVGYGPSWTGRSSPVGVSGVHKPM